MRPTLLLSVDFEDWHQLVRRRLGTPGWEQPGPALARQTDALLAVLDELGARATFFVLGMAARAHPELVQRVAARGHEIACHGDAHLPVHRQHPEEFAADLRAAVKTIAQITGRRPIGYRAPAFSITQDASWAHQILMREGFAYDSSHHDSFLIRRRVRTGRTVPHRLDGGLWELPVAVWHAPIVSLPVGGASYWSVTPGSVVLQGLSRAGELAGLYLHPHELDPEPLQVRLPPDAPLGQLVRGRVRAAQRNAARRRAPQVLRSIAGRFRLIPYGEAHAQLSDGLATGT